MWLSRFCFQNPERKSMFVRLLEKEDGTFNIQWSNDDGKTWHDEVHRKMFLKKLAERHAKGTYPKAKYLGTVKEH